MHFIKAHISRETAGLSLLDIIAKRLDISRNKAKSIIDSRNVFVNGKRVWMAKHTLQQGDLVEIPAPSSGNAEQDQEKNSLFRD
ncbi:MAG: hypothetical protein GX811_06970 [Lentisphaerae bacterium]|nr:hypothetical protein [Lentisphaerota bacterium]